MEGSSQGVGQSVAIRSLLRPEASHKLFERQLPPSCCSCVNTNDMICCLGMTPELSPASMPVRRLCVGAKCSPKGSTTIKRGHYYEKYSTKISERPAYHGYVGSKSHHIASTARCHQPVTQIGALDKGARKLLLRPRKPIPSSHDWRNSPQTA